MSFSRRKFLKKTTILTGSYPFLNYVDHWTNSNSSVFDGDWEKIRQLFPILSWDKLHLNSGSAGVMAQPVQDALFDLIREMNSKAPYAAWGEWQETKKQNIERIASHLNAEPQELMVVRNTTEALNMIIYGIPLNKGDEVLASKHDYPFALNAINQRSKRDGIRPVLVEPDLGRSEDEIIAEYEKAISPKTKVMLLTLMTHRQGQIMPVKKLTELAHQNNVQVVLDAAHAFAQFSHDIRDLNVDYYASSLHKWLNAPHGTGLIFCKKKLIPQLMPHPSSNIDTVDSMNKYEHIGTRAFHQEIGISAALDFHEWVGPEAKQNRLHKLKLYWTQKVRDIQNVILYTPLGSDSSCAVATFGIDGLSGGKIVQKLDKDFNIHAKSVGGTWGSGVRISSNLFTNEEDLDRLIVAIEKLSNHDD